MVPEIGVKIPDILLPKSSIDLTKWSVIACDQFTSEPEYWQQVKQIVGDSPSTYHMVLPEVYLGTEEEQKRLETTPKIMQQYLNSEIFHRVNDFIYVRRTIDGKTRRGLMVCLDLEQYDFNKGAQTLIRATEGTILNRLPPRIQIREKALLECPHILVLFDDPADKVFGLLDEMRENLIKIYDFDLMLDSGHLSGYTLVREDVQEQVYQTLHKLIDPEKFSDKYNLKPGLYKPFLFAMGDGNHSLATAKAIWQKLKPTSGMNHPARYALVEIENVHDPALNFESIHRLVINIQKNLIDEMRHYWGNNVQIKNIGALESLITIVDETAEPWHQIGMIDTDGLKLIEIHDPESNLPVGTLQQFLDVFLKDGGAKEIDYVHGTKALLDIGSKPGNAGFYLPAMDKSNLFKTVILDGALPRKTFSMGEAKEKRFYLECRRIQI